MRTLFFPIVIGLTAPVGVLSGQTTGTLTGRVRQVGAEDRPVSYANIVFGRREVSSDSAGRFRLDSLPAGEHIVRIRAIGFVPLTTRVTVAAGSSLGVEFILNPAPVILPTIEALGRRTGLYGHVVGPTLLPLPGATVSILGFRGGEMLTDSLGLFAFANAHGGAYMVTVSHPDFPSRTLTLEVPKNSGRELGFRLTPGARTPTAPGEAAALWELGRRLSMSFREVRMMPAELQRFGTMRLCDVPKIQARAGASTTVILNGVMVLRGVSLCAWRMDEIALLEFCDKQGCYNPDAPQPLRYPDLSGRPQRGTPVVLWEKR